jgi:hypothetical protein
MTLVKPLENHGVAESLYLTSQNPLALSEREASL